MVIDSIRGFFGNTKEKKRSEDGVGLVTAIVVISALAMLGTVMMQLIVNEREAATRSVSSIRALLAARTAQEWAMYQTFTNSSHPAQMAGGNSQVFKPSKVDDKSSLGECLSWTGVAKTPEEEPLPNGQIIYSITVEGTCYEGTSSEARRRQKIRFYDPSP